MTATTIILRAHLQYKRCVNIKLEVKIYYQINSEVRELPLTRIRSRFLKKVPVETVY